MVLQVDYRGTKRLL